MQGAGQARAGACTAQSWTTDFPLEERVSLTEEEGRRSKRLDMQGTLRDTGNSEGYREL
jgi:hypothetical protein